MFTKLLVLLACSSVGYGFCGPCGADERCNFCYDCDFDTYIGVVAGGTLMAGNYREHHHGLDEFHETDLEGSSGLVGGVFGFQTYVCDKFFAALQANFLYNTLRDGHANVENDLGVVVETVKLENWFQGGLDARVGRFIHTAAAYFIFGFEAGHWTMDFTNESGTTFRGIPANRTLHNIKCLCGPRLGLGLTLPVFKCTWINFEYSYTWFGTFRRHLNDVLTGTWEHKVKVRQQSFLFGINFLL